MELKPLRVSEINHYINRILSNDVLLYNMSVEGEVSNCKYHSSGHIYFSLKDEKSKIRCVMFAGNASSLSIELKDGMKVVVTGSINIYEKDGSYQINVRKARDEGRGELYEAFEALKEKLYLEGLFDEDRKKQIPKYPRKIGLVTSITGATLKDMVVNIRRRNPAVDIVIKPAIVQGRDSAQSVVEAIESLNAREDIDTIIVGRGGGSIEELWSFNEEAVARAIYGSRIPIISAVGHETDYTISDFVADLRASTPSVAAEVSVQPLKELTEKLELFKSRLQTAERERLRDAGLELSALESRLSHNSPKDALKYSRAELDLNMEKLRSAVLERFRVEESSLQNLGAKLDSLSPLRTLDRGYVFVEGEAGSIVSSKSDVGEGEKLKLRFKDGAVEVKVEKID
ncbi:exodeoxyribonuclease 7 large subunit [Andreesenia angusta]|uniref:Exodeoxyribonuclease 7 large subunit n=1 Tax=Andreesenia angusta TaxID=39480 RepID=A0A1S1VA31_9FIRM|nr:exodeoxyribonuclease VII large subunit [Andreesenia angusta]OHW62987.1 exodeoxyribonuclease 7 large subunit [Andreesenia angusta]